MIKKYWRDINSCCRDEVAYHAVMDVRTKEVRDYLATYFYAETLKYFYVAFAGKEIFDFDEHVFNTEAHLFRKSNYDKKVAKRRLGY